MLELSGEPRSVSCVELDGTLVHGSGPYLMIYMRIVSFSSLIDPMTASWTMVPAPGEIDQHSSFYWGICIAYML